MMDEEEIIVQEGWFDNDPTGRRITFGSSSEFGMDHPVLILINFIL